MISFYECSRDSAFGQRPVRASSIKYASEPNIVPLGGLRVGARWALMQLEAPRLSIEGHDGQPVYVTMPMNLEEEGYINQVIYLQFLEYIR